jgi:hypothetical protein
MRCLLVSASRGPAQENRRDLRILKETWWFIVSPIFWGLMLWGVVI